MFIKKKSGNIRKAMLLTCQRWFIALELLAGVILLTKEKRETDDNRMRDLLRTSFGSVIFAVDPATDSQRVWRDTSDAILVLMTVLGK